MSVTVFLGPAIPKARRELANYLRELAEHLDKDEIEIDPYAFVLCLTGPASHEVVHTGYDTLSALRGAAKTVNAVLSPSYETIGGNRRSRERREYGGFSEAKVTPISAAIRPTATEGETP